MNVYDLEGQLPRTVHLEADARQRREAINARSNALVGRTISILVIGREEPFTGIVKVADEFGIRIQGAPTRLISGYVATDTLMQNLTPIYIPWTSVSFITEDAK